MTSLMGGELAGRPFLQQLRAEEKRELISAGVVRLVPAGAGIYSEGRRSPRIAILLTAHAEVVTRACEGERWLASRVPGDILGELSLVDGRPHSATVRIVRPGQVVQLSHEAFDRVMRRHEGITRALLRVLAHRLRSADAIRGTDRGPTLVRVANLLARPAVGAGGAPVRFQREIAEVLGVSRSSVVRALTELRRRGLVVTGHGTVSVADPAGLARLLEEAGQRKC
ncbi:MULTISPECIES: Crp/Fnr family transcriptional regulator [unclassified Actinomadura]|uniref:Crp/Fnr family transcriptional regulator n=1 Tax=unclassified Actinomadura TaxID=2626254 RepID=UPI00135C9F98|nr:Crp/Fnr family transcriptional regulator [Actinomadura sp. K4S16]